MSDEDEPNPSNPFAKLRDDSEETIYQESEQILDNSVEDVQTRKFGEAQFPQRPNPQDFIYVEDNVGSSDSCSRICEEELNLQCPPI